MFYAKFDWTVRQENPGTGFSNTKKAYAFRTKKERDTFVKSRWFDLSCVEISHKQTKKLVESLPCDSTDKGVIIYDPLSDMDYPAYKVLKKGRF
jgi:5,10-methylene-tetrahydrofolate dehydrogenase/methenyl tetrahydrofolate cyclohydrolase